MPAEIIAQSIVIDGVYVIALLAGAGSVIGILFKMLLASKENEFKLLMTQKEKALADLESQKKSYQEVASEALKSAMDTANYYRQRDGKAPIIPLPAVVSESHSPSTPEQRETAALATMRATMAQVKVITGQEPRTEQPPAETPVPEGVKEGIIAVLKHSIEEVPDRTAAKVVEKLEEKAVEKTEEKETGTS